MIQILKIGKSIQMLPLIWIMIAACSASEEIIPKPVILVNSKDPRHWDGSISGSIVGAEPRLHFVSVYAEIYDAWYSMSRSPSAKIVIENDQTWICPIQTVEIKTADKVQIFLFPVGFEPPLLAGENVVPLKLHLAATAKLSIELNHSEN